MFFLDHIWLIPLLPAFGATMMFFFGRKLQKQAVDAVCVGVVVLAFLLACGAVWQKRQHHHANADCIYRLLLQLAPEKEHHRRAECRQQWNEPDVIEKEHAVW